MIVIGHIPRDYKETDRSRLRFLRGGSDRSLKAVNSLLLYV